MCHSLGVHVVLSHNVLIFSFFISFIISLDGSDQVSAAICKLNII